MSDSSFILKSVKTSGFYLHFQTIRTMGNQGFAITLVGRSHGEYYAVNTYSYFPLQVPQDSVCLNDTLDFTSDSGD